MSERVLLRGGHVLSMDEAVGELPAGDVLIEDGRIAAVAPLIDVHDADLVDVAGHVVMPGFVDTHRHTWQTPFRGVCADWTLEDYFRGIRSTISPNCSAADVYAGNHVGALEALDAGVTTILDFSHCMNTPEHADAALAGTARRGDPGDVRLWVLPGPCARAGLRRARRADRRRAADPRARASSDDALVTMGVALTEVGLLPFDQTIAEARSARELGVPDRPSHRLQLGLAVTEGIPELDRHGLLGPDQVHVHCNTLDDRDFRRLADNGCKVSSSPETELQMGMGHPVIRRALEHGMRPSLSCDVMSSNWATCSARCGSASSSSAACATTVQRAQPHAGRARPDGSRRAPLGHRQRRRMPWASRSRIGSITPGKQADDRASVAAA